MRYGAASNRPVLGFEPMTCLFVVTRGKVVQAGDAEHRVVDTVALETAVPEGPAGPHPDEGVLDEGVTLRSRVVFHSGRVRGGAG